MAMLANEDGLQTRFINGVINGTNVPNMDEKEAVARLKELGYDTTRIEQVMANDAKSGEVVPINKEVVDENK